MTALSGRDIGTPQRGAASPRVRYLTPIEASEICRMSVSWLAKARMNGDGPPFVKFGRAVRYEETALHQWVKTRERHSTSEDDARKRPEFTE
jgi:predicted DNA-binding transcriptional regulator AlpA